MERGYLLSGSDGQGSLMGRNGEPGAGLAVARGGVELGVGARFARFGTGAGTSNVASDPLRDRTAKSDRKRKHRPQKRDVRS